MIDGLLMTVFACSLQVSQIEVPILPASPIGIPLYDKDKMAWELEADTNGDTLKFRLIYKDAKNIPKNHIRCEY